VVQIVMAVHDLLRGPRQTASPSMAGIVSRCDRFIQQHLAEHIGARDLVKHAHVHPSTFFARFRQQAGMTPGDYLRRARIQRARELLVRTNRSITEIALDCGFSSSQHFADCFKEYTGAQPSRFRREFRAPRLGSG
jgi:transcriptional regulator GlxA family with amidase domain